MRNLTRLFFVLAPLAAALTLLSACDDAGPASVAADTSSADTSAPEDLSTPDAETAADTAEAAPPWPEGPYGIGYMEVMANESFFDPFTGKTVRLSDFYLNPNVNGIVIVSAAGWCTACSYESWDLVTVQDKYADDGVVVLYTLYEDRQGRPLWEVDAPYEDLDRDMTFMTEYRENLGSMVGLTPRVANYPVLIDQGFTLSRYYHKNATPMTIILRASDMRILYKEVGYSAGTVELMVKSTLY